MKPRLKSVPLTDEDRLIWMRINNRFWDKYPDLFVSDSAEYIHADRRDADLMLFARQHRDLYSDLCGIEIRGDVQWLELFEV